MMLQALREAKEALSGAAGAFDPALHPATDCQRIVEVASAVERIAASVKTLAAARVAETDLWRRNGARSAAHDLAKRTGVGVGAARDALRTGEQLRDLPIASAAARAGELSPQQAQAIADAASADPSAERRLVEQAKRSSLGELRDECARTKAAVEDLEARRRRIHAERFCRRRTTPDGAGEIHYRATIDDMARIWAVLQGFADRAFKRAKAEGRHEHTDAYAADALAAMAEAAAGPARAGDVHAGTDPQARPDPTADGDPPAPPAAPDPAAPPARPDRRPVPTTLIVRIDWDALVRGHPIEGELCEIAGVGPVPVSVVEELLRSGDPFLAAVVTKGRDVVNVAHLGRRHTAHQRTAMAWRDPMCVVEGCAATLRLEHDHRHDWSKTKLTLLDWSDRLCPHHHDLKSHQGWRLVDGTGKRPMVPPGHPDHPGDDPPDPPGGGGGGGPPPGVPRGQRAARTPGPHGGFGGRHPPEVPLAATPVRTGRPPAG